MDFQSKVVNFLNDRKKNLQQFLQPVTPTVQSFGNNLRQDIQSAIQQGQAVFWNKRNPVANTWLNLQKATPAYQQGGAQAFEFGNFLRNSNSIADYIPRFQASTNSNLFQKIPSFIGNIPVEMGANIVGRAVVDPITDIGRLWGNAALGKNSPQYNTLKSPLTRLGYNTLGINNKPQQIMGNTAGIISPVLDAYSGGFVTNLAKNAFKETLKQTLKRTATTSALEGGSMGGFYGLLQGLADNRNETLEKQVSGAGQNAVLGAGLGFVGGGVLGGFSHILGKILNKSPEVIGQLRDSMGRYAKGQTPVKPKGMADAAWKFQLEFNKQYKRNPYTPVYPEDLQKAIKFELEKKGAGLSIRDVTKELYPTQEPEQKLLNAVNPQISNQPILNDTVSGQYETFGQTQADNAFTPTVPQIKVKPQAQIQKEVGENALLQEANKRGYNNSNPLNNISNVRIELEAEHTKAKDFMNQMVNKYINQVTKQKSVLDLMTPQEVKTMELLNKQADRAYQLLTSQKSSQPLKQTKQLGSYTNTREDMIAPKFRNEFAESLGESTPTKELGITLKKETAQSPQAFESTQDILQRQQSQSKIGETLEQIIDKPEINVKQKVNLLDYVRTPDRVLQKMGLGDEAKLIRKKHEDYMRELPENINQITKWANQVSKESNQRIFQYLDGQKITLDANELKVANEIRDWLKVWADRLNLPEDRRITNYITHLFDKELIEKEFDPEIARLIRDKIPGSVYDPFVQERLGKLGFKEDTWGALDAYVKRATRKVHMDEALEKVSAKADMLEDSQFRYVKAYVDRINLRPTAMDNLIDNGIKSIIGYRLGQRPTTAVTRTIRQMVYRGTLGLNAGSALRNLSQGVNTYAKLGEKYTVLGYANLLKNWRSGELQRVGVLRDDFIQDRTMNATKQGWEKADKKLFFLFELAEKINRGSAYFGAKAKALANGASEEEAIEAGKKLVRDTQFTFGSVDTPQILQSDLAKTLLQFQSYNLKQGEFLTEMVKNREVAGLVRYTGASMLFMMSAGSLIGMKPTDFIPFWGVLTGQTKLGQTPPVQLGIDVVKTITGAKGQFGEELTLQDRAEKFGNDLVPFVPGGVQLKKTVEGLINTKKGYSESASGRVKFPIDPTTSNYVRAGLFGTNNLPVAQDYYNNKRKVLGEVQSEEFKELDSEDRKTFIQSIYDEREQNKLNDDEANKPTSFFENLISKSSASDGVTITKDPLANTLIDKTTASSDSKKLSDVKKQDNQIDKANKKKFEKTGKAFVSDNVLYYDKNGDGSVNTIKLTNTSSVKAAGIDAFNEGSSNASIAREIWSIPNDQLSGSEKEKIFKQLGYTKQEVEYDYKSSDKFSAQERLAYINSQNLDHETLIKRLETGRVKSISGNLFANDTLIDLLVEDGKLSKAEAKALKAMDYKDGVLQGKKSTGGGGLKGKSIDFRQFIRKASKTNSIKFKAVKLPKMANIKSVGKSTKKFKEFKYKNKPFSLKKKA